MNVSRDRLSRPVDISSLLETAERRVNLVVDEPGLRWTGLTNQDVARGQSSGVKSIKRRVGLQRIRRRGYINRSLVGKENQRPWTVRKGQGSRGGSVLPSWYPRTPLRDITAIVRAIERKRAKLYNNDQTIEASQQDTDASTPNTQHENSTSIPDPQACKVVDNIADQKGKGADFSTPQKNLLNSIDDVRQIWLEDQQKVNRTPAAKKAERQKKVRVLMSMR